MTMLDRRLNAYRPDLADERLKGQVESAQFVSGTLKRVAVPVVDLRAQPSLESGPQTQAIFGEVLRVFGEADGWCWAQAERDGYTGYVSAASLAEIGNRPTHRVIVPRTFIYPGCDLRLPNRAAISLGSELVVVGSAETRGTQYAMLADGSAVIAKHLMPIGEFATDFVSVAEQLLHTPYLWGGTSGFGIDCSGLVQLSMKVCGRNVLRDTDMQQASIGQIIEPDADYSNLQRGDLVFWKGHVAICQAPDLLIHASGHTMTVTLEPVREAITRIAYLYDLPTLIRRPA